ncbi:hypothetical protein CEXT_599381 [Caerostris extrusa]|uniref:Uncharacterized protein n=1 Tax=Caerostris extrusa TaxID=172846 RepID=A0AAV4P448_CAEEX|nr:hypothetical protein CEXT_599381 [Caerostris extrusa]
MIEIQSPPTNNVLKDVFNGSLALSRLNHKALAAGWIPRDPPMRTNEQKQGITAPIVTISVMNKECTFNNSRH